MRRVELSCPRVPVGAGDGATNAEQKTAAIHARVSIFQQQPRTHLRVLREYAHRRRNRIAYELVDIETGAIEDRPNLQKLMDLAAKDKVDIVLVWKFDPWQRGLAR